MAVPGIVTLRHKPVAAVTDGPPGLRAWPMHLFDIQEAIEEIDLGVLRQAFGVLICYPHQGHIEGARTTARLVHLFDIVALALELDDQATMPEILCRAIERFARVPIEPASTFSHGAIVAAEFRDRWLSVLLAETHGPLVDAAGL